VATKLLIALLASLAIGAHASPIEFTSTQYDTAAFALTGAVADANSDISPPSALPLLSTATAAGANDFATSAAFGGPSLFFTLTEADSFAVPSGPAPERSRTSSVPFSVAVG